MRVDELRERPAVEAHPRSDQREHQRDVLVVARVDDDAAGVAAQDHVIGRQPVAHEHVHLRRQRRALHRVATFSIVRAFARLGDVNR